LQGVEAARAMVRLMLNRIVQEVDIIAKMPELASREDRPLPYMSPFLFKELLPVCYSEVPMGYRILTEFWL
jgi:hypothetical protein